MIESAVLGGYVHAGMAEMVAEYEKRFGLDQPLWIQYFRYIGDVSRATSTTRSRTSRAR